MDLSTYIILGVATAAKVVLFAYCFSLKGQSDSMMALAEDHSNDIISNLGARTHEYPPWADRIAQITSALLCRRQCDLQHTHGYLWNVQPQHIVTVRHLFKTLGAESLV